MTAKPYNWIDRTGDTRDRYGRLLRYVYLNGDNFNARLIREGYAHAIRGFRYSMRFSLSAWKMKPGNAGKASGPRAETAAPKLACGGVLMRREIPLQAPGYGPSLYDPLTGDSREGDAMPGAIRAMIETCADRKTGVAMLPLTFAVAAVHR